MKTIPEQIFDLGRDCHQSGEGIWNRPCYPTPDKTGAWQWKEAVELAKSLDPIPTGYDPDDEYYWSGDDMIFQSAMREFEKGHDAAVEEEQQTIEETAMREAKAFERLFEKAQNAFAGFKYEDGDAIFGVHYALADSSRYITVSDVYRCEIYIKIRISDHEASPFRESEFGAATCDLVYQSEEEFFKAIERAEAHLEKHVALAIVALEAENKKAKSK